MCPKTIHHYDNHAIRRQDRLLDAERANQLLETAEYGILSTIAPDGTPYGIPLNYVWDGADTIYIHCAPVGHKLQAIESHPEISFCIVGNVCPQPEHLTTLYESIIIRGEAHIHLPDEERRQALRLLVRKFAPDQIEHSERSIEKSFHRTEIIRILIHSVSGKAKRPKK